MNREYIPPSEVTPVPLAPNSLEGEEAVLGSVLINPDAIPEVAHILKPGDFFTLRYAWIWLAILAVHSRGEAVDILTVSQELRVRDQLEAVGGAARLTYLINQVPTHIHAVTYAGIVERAAIRRKLLNGAQKIGQVALAEDNNMDAAELVRTGHAILDNIVPVKPAEKLGRFTAAMDARIEEIEALADSGQTLMGLPTHYRELDNILKGLRPEALYTIGARPGVGKTTLLVNLIIRVLRDGKSVAFHSLEMTCQEIIDKMLGCITGLPTERIEVGDLHGDEWIQLSRAQAEMREWKFYLDDSIGITPEAVRSKDSDIATEFGLDLVAVDYLQLMRSAKKIDNRAIEVGELALSLKELARELHLPVLSLAQLNRAVEQRADKRPQLSDLRESGAIEQHSPIVMFLHREEMYTENPERPHEMEVIVAKNRFGRRGHFSLYADLACSRFEDLSREEVNFQ